jgi:predicted permease
MDTLLQDLRFSLRLLQRQPGFTALLVLTLALGIGANTAIFSAVDGVLLRPLALPAPERLVLVWGHHPDTGRQTVSLPDFLDWREGSPAFESLAAFGMASLNLTGGGEPEQLRGVRVTANYFETLGLWPILGRTFETGEDRQGRSPVVVLSQGFWTRRMGADPAVLGKTLTLDGMAHTIIGVVPEGIRFPSQGEVWVPLATDEERPRRWNFLVVIGRLTAGATMERAQAELTALTSRLEQAYPATNQQVTARIVPLQADLASRTRPALLVFMGAVGLVLLIACANVANLMLARAGVRERELAVRAALGASRGRLIRQMLTESLLLSMMGGALGLLLAEWGIDALRASQLDLFPAYARIGIDWRVLGFTLALSVVTGVLAGLAPALRLSGSHLDSTLRAGARGFTGGSLLRQLRGLLVLSEVALALVLLVGAALLLRSFDRLQHEEPGFDPQGVLTLRVVLPQLKYPEDPQLAAFFQQLTARAAVVPGVQAAGIVTAVPLGDGTPVLDLSIEGRTPAPGAVEDAEVFSVSPGYFQTMGLPLLSGRLIEPQDDASAPDVAVIKEALARRYLPGKEPLGARLSLDDGENWITIVGVVRGVRSWALQNEPAPQLYLSLPQRPRRAMYLAVRTTGEPAELTGALRRELSALDPELPMADVRTMEQRLEGAVARPRVNMFLLGGFAGVALLLAGIGIYGVISQMVVQRTREIGIRMALGARSRDVMRLIIRQGIFPALVGIGLGLAAALAGSRLLESLLYGVTATDPLTFLIVPVFLAGVALLAAWLPARRATRVDPTEALRQE